MAGTTLPAILLDLVTASANAVTGIQAYQGKKIWNETDSVENEVRALTAEEQGRAWFWIGSRQSQAYPWQPFTVTIKGLLLLRLDRDVGSVMDKAYDKIEELANKLENATTFSAVPAVPFGGTWENVEDGSPEDNVMQVSFTFTYRVGPECDT